MKSPTAAHRHDFRVTPATKPQHLSIVPNRDKSDARAWNLAALRGAFWLAQWDGNRHGLPNHLNLDWLELCGEVGPDHTVHLLDSALGPDAAHPHGTAKFIGVDHDASVIQRARAYAKANNLPHTLWVEGVLHRLLDDEPRAFENVGVVNFDLRNSWFHKPIAQQVEPVLRFIEGQAAKHDEALLLVNGSVRGGPREQVEDHVRRALGSHGDALGPDDFFRYTARGNTMEMLTIRLRLGYP